LCAEFRDRLQQSHLLTAKAKMLTTNRILSTMSSRHQTGGATTVLGCDALPKPNVFINRQLQKPLLTGVLSNKQLMVNHLLTVGDSLTNKLLTTRNLGSLETTLGSTQQSGDLRPNLSSLSSTHNTLLDNHKSCLTPHLTSVKTSKPATVKESPLFMSRKNKENTSIRVKQAKKTPSLEAAGDDFQMPKYEMLMTEFEDEFGEATAGFVPQQETLQTHVVEDPQQMKVYQLVIHVKYSLCHFFFFFTLVKYPFSGCCYRRR